MRRRVRFVSQVQAECLKDNGSTVEISTEQASGIAQLPALVRDNVRVPQQAPRRHAFIVGIFADSLSSEVVMPAGSPSSGYTVTFQIGVSV
jgi:hypothetical protein